MKSNRPKTTQPTMPGFLARIVRQLVARCGYVLMPITEIERMESDAKSDYDAVRKKSDPRTCGYFNGMADYASKKAIQLREKYLPNAAGHPTRDKNL